MKKFLMGIMHELHARGLMAHVKDVEKFAIHKKLSRVGFFKTDRIELIIDVTQYRYTCPPLFPVIDVCICIIVNDAVNSYVLRSYVGKIELIKIDETSTISTRVKKHILKHVDSLINLI